MVCLWPHSRQTQCLHTPSQHSSFLAWISSGDSGGGFQLPGHTASVCFALLEIYLDILKSRIKLQHWEPGMLTRGILTLLHHTWIQVEGNRPCQTSLLWQQYIKEGMIPHPFCSSNSWPGRLWTCSKAKASNKAMPWAVAAAHSLRAAAAGRGTGQTPCSVTCLAKPRKRARPLTWLAYTMTLLPHLYQQEMLCLIPLHWSENCHLSLIISFVYFKSLLLTSCSHFYLWFIVSTALNQGNGNSCIWTEPHPQLLQIASMIFKGKSQMINNMMLITMYDQHFKTYHRVIILCQLSVF